MERIMTIANFNIVSVEAEDTRTLTLKKKNKDDITKVVIRAIVCTDDKGESHKAILTPTDWTWDNAKIVGLSPLSDVEGFCEKKSNKWALKKDVIVEQSDLLAPAHAPAAANDIPDESVYGGGFANKAAKTSGSGKLNNTKKNPTFADRMGVIIRTRIKDLAFNVEAVVSNYPSTQETSFELQNWMDLVEAEFISASEDSLTAWLNKRLGQSEEATTEKAEVSTEAPESSETEDTQAEEKVEEKPKKKATKKSSKKATPKKKTVAKKTVAKTSNDEVPPPTDDDFDGISMDDLEKQAAEDSVKPNRKNAGGLTGLTMKESSEAC